VTAKTEDRARQDPENKNYKTRHLLVNFISLCLAVLRKTCPRKWRLSVQIDIFAPKPVQEAVEKTVEVTYKPTATIDHTDLEINIPANNTYIDTNIHVSGKLLGGSDMTGTDFCVNKPHCAAVG
jgi:hypothetical protein